ncbi:uncharacterized protein L969DRAFT_52402 [Mixia osmundae IAM 14324]|uniref:Amine oxidase domain-containing protein n=1 Tax=Mixia osmundae (strain CBS 9802 / IAM 14324 / JCM 22182 / KY 12970) TaxID=764103 RepID=G7EA61_MIXOS|nr:uncharacterized protein L969DRAFT_52402 [Mixia osmundae IAM 14324]KEI37619.1 hypothetical protein L969DRAFT_52402 [Mixia osmundae IAM 14324]GAA99721.1 hypothetical protein E5Q_06424 [Mixia osmundae IAM 14324]
MPDCIVIGAGISGLWAGLQLLRAGRSVAILEARSRLGGRIRTASKADGLPCPVDLGASFVHGQLGNPLATILRDLRIELHHADDPGLMFESNGKPLDEETSGQLAASVFTTLFDRSRAEAQTGATVPSYTRSLADYLLDRKRSPLYDGLETEQLKRYATSMATSFDGWSGASLQDVSFRAWGEEHDYEGGDALVRYGYGQLIDVLKMAIQARGGEIHLNTQVTSVALSEDEDSVTVSSRNASSTTNASDLSAPFALVTVPLGVLKANRIRFEPTLPPRRLASIDRLGFGLLNKVVMSFPRVWWPKQGSWTMLLRDCDPDGRHPLSTRTIMFQSYASITESPVLVMYLGARAGEAIEQLSDEEAKQWAHGLLVDYLAPSVQGEIPQPERVIVTRWQSDEHALGSYTYTPVATEAQLNKGEDPATLLDYFELSKPLWEGRLGMAGEHTSQQHQASVHGALLSGQREARRIHLELAAAEDDLESKQDAVDELMPLRARELAIKPRL